MQINELHPFMITDKHLYEHFKVRKKAKIRGQYQAMFLPRQDDSKTRKNAK